MVGAELTSPSGQSARLSDVVVTIQIRARIRIATTGARTSSATDHLASSLATSCTILRFQQCFLNACALFSFPFSIRLPFFPSLFFLPNPPPSRVRGIRLRPPPLPILAPHTSHRPISSFFSVHFLPLLFLFELGRY